MAPNPFPSTSRALSEPNGLLAHGGDLSPETLLLTYAQGIFPWFDEGQEILWWSPDPRMVLRPSDIHISRSLRRTLRNKDWQIRYDTDFKSVITCCAKARQRESTGADTWITEEMLQAYTTLHNLGPTSGSTFKIVKNLYSKLKTEKLSLEPGTWTPPSIR